MNCPACSSVMLKMNYYSAQDKYLCPVCGLEVLGEEDKEPWVPLYELWKAKHEEEDRKKKETK